MTIAILADNSAFEEISKKGFENSIEWIRADTLKSLTMIEADAYFDLQFEASGDRVNALRFVLPKPVFISAVTNTLEDLGEQRFIRINAWAGMINRTLIELVIGKETSAEYTMNGLGWKYTAVADVPGMITPRIISAIINEAYFALADGISTEQEIDMAMQAGTNYPYGPFEWAKLIGHEEILTLLKSLYPFKRGYDIAPALVNKSND
ncbi:MAG: 3-hydroxyacyl-CoA dehydrogenase family protein [Flavitalea sp.]